MVYASTPDILCKTTADTKSIVAQVEIFLEQNHYKVEIPSSSSNKTVFYVKDSNSTSAEYVLISVCSNTTGSYVYYFNNGTHFDFKDPLNKKLKNSKIKLKQLNNKELLSYFKEDALVIKQNFDAKKLNNPQSITYDFSDEAQKQYDEKKATQASVPESNADIKKTKDKKQKNFIASEQQPVNQPVSTYVAPTNKTKTLKGTIVNVPSGISFDASLQSTIDSASLEQNDRITATLNTDFVYKGMLVAPAGSILYGKAIKVSHPTYASGNGDMELVFNQILTPNGTKIAISSNKIVLKATKNRAASISINAVKGATVGALAGLITCAMTNGDASAIWRGAAIGAVGSGIAHKGENVMVKPGTPLQIKLNQPLNTSPYQ